MKKLILLLAIPLLFSCTSKKDKVDEIKTLLEWGLEEAYYEGQRDALEGDIRIKLNDDSIYIWSKSPWDDGQEPIFKPGQEPIPIEL